MIKSFFAAVGAAAIVALGADLVATASSAVSTANAVVGAFVHA